MSDDVKVIDISETLPSSIAYDDNIQALSKLLTAELTKLTPSIDKLTVLPHLSELSDKIIDQLAWHLHVDFYDQEATRKEREQLIYNSIAWHRKKGTVGIVEDMVKLIGDEAEVIENWGYGGKPYHFKIAITSNNAYDQTKIARIVEAVQSVKNVRSKLDGIEFNSKARTNIFVGGRMAYVEFEQNVPIEFNNEPKQKVFTGGRMVIEVMETGGIR